jgi:hypothetical protein
MKTTNPFRAVAVATVLLCAPTFAPHASARLVNPFTFNELLEKSDVIAIVEAIRDEPAKDTFKPDNITRFVGINTHFRVHLVLKGKVETKEVTVLHFWNEEPRIENGPECADFRFTITYTEEHFMNGENVGSVAVHHPERPMWLAFLKKRNDGRFEPVAGQLDSAFSFCIMPQRECGMHRDLTDL